MIATAVSSVVSDGRAAGCRAIDLRVEAGISLRLLPDRGLDAADAWFAGVPLDWRSPVGETATVDWDWMQSFIYGAGDSGSMIQGHLLTARPVGRSLLSGGVTGPEGSILALPFIAISVLVVAFALHGCAGADPIIGTKRTEPLPPA